MIFKKSCASFTKILWLSFIEITSLETAQSEMILINALQIMLQIIQTSLSL